MEHCSQCEKADIQLIGKDWSISNSTPMHQYDHYLSVRGMSFVEKQLLSYVFIPKKKKKPSRTEKKSLSVRKKKTQLNLVQ